jgi:hypothetical protein
MFRSISIHSKRVNLLTDERIAEYAWQRTNLRRQLLHCWVCHWPGASSDACDSGTPVNTNPNTGDPMVCHDFLYIISYECLPPVRDSFLDWTVRERLLPSHDCKFGRSRAVGAVLTCP